MIGRMADGVPVAQGGGLGSVTGSEDEKKMRKKKHPTKGPQNRSDTCKLET